jgi:hypothetical protein
MFINRFNKYLKTIDYIKINDLIGKEDLDNRVYEAEYFIIPPLYEENKWIQEEEEDNLLYGYGISDIVYRNIRNRWILQDRKTNGYHKNFSRKDDQIQKNIKSLILFINDTYTVIKGRNPKFIVYIDYLSDHQFNIPSRIVKKTHSELTKLGIENKYIIFSGLINASDLLYVKRINMNIVAYVTNGYNCLEIYNAIKMLKWCPFEIIAPKMALDIGTISKLLTISDGLSLMNYDKYQFFFDKLKNI